MEQIFLANELKRLGRCDDTHPELGFSMCGVKFRAACTEVHVEINCQYGEHSPWMGVLVDGAPVGRFPLMQGRHWYCALAGMAEGFPHDVSIVRDSQPVPEDPARQFITVERVKIVGERLPLEKPDMVIEFAGDSLTSGEGTLGPYEAREWRMAYMSAMNTFAQMVCCEMKAEGRWISQSGWGIHAGWGGDEKCSIPLIYDRVCATDEAGQNPYDFTREPADWVIVNLGSNDAAPMGRLESLAQRRAFRRKVHEDAVAFLENIRRLNPRAQVLWVYGMCGRPLEKEIRSAVEKLQAAGDAGMHYLRVPRVRDDEIGSRQHPGAPSHRKVAQAITAFMKTFKENG